VSDLKVEKTRKFIAFTAFAVYIIILLRLAVFRDDFLSYGLFRHGTFNIVPLAAYLKLYSTHAYYFMFIQFAGNIGWFIPFGFLLPFITVRFGTLKPILLFGFLLSFIIELSQFAFGTGVTELDDLILNTFGVAVGFWLYRLYRRISKKIKK
jgi:glycopeptide antibiotics resistance protein